MWPDVLTRVYQQRRATWTFVSEHAQVIDYDGKRLRLAISTDGLLQTFRRGPHAELVRQALIDVLGVDAQVEGIRPEGSGPAGPSTSPSPSTSPGSSAGSNGPGSTSSSAHAAERPDVSPGDRAAAAARSWDEPPPEDPGDSEPPPPEAQAPPARPSGRQAAQQAAQQAARQAGRPNRQGPSAPGPTRPTRPAAGAAAADPPDPPDQYDGANEHNAPEEPDEPHPDDPDLAGSGLMGQSVVEQLLGGRVIDEQ